MRPPHEPADGPADARGGDAGGVTGLVALFARHPTAPNLLMIVLLLVGAFAMLRLNRQFFPDFDMPQVTVSVTWPGASAEDAEKSILDVLEPELRFLDDVEEVISYAREGNATIVIEFKPTADMQKAQSDIEQAVGRVTTLPQSAERPLITRVKRFDRVANVSVSGPFSEQVLRSYAKRVRDGLLAAGIDSVALNGVRDEEVWITIREEALQRLGLTLDQVAQRVRENSEDLPAGLLEGPAELQLRAKVDRKTPEELAAIEIKALATGEKVRLSDIATVETRFERGGRTGWVKGEPAVELAIERSLSADTIKTMELALAYIERARKEMPPTLRIQVYDVAGKLVQQRLGILVDNGLQGLALVLLTLFVFLNARVAFWTAVGIPTAMLATLAVMYVTGQSINMVSMFALIMMLGIVVDDAIVVGEHAATLEEEGRPRQFAAEQGALRMLAPVTAATFTTCAAFLPMFFIGDRIGDILRAIPLVVISCLAASLIECFLILPGHLRHGHAARRARRPNPVRRAFDGAFEWVRDRLFAPLVAAAYAWRYTTLAILVGGFIVAVGMLAGDRVKFVFFPNLPPENLTASITFAPGLPRDQQVAALASIEAALYGAERRIVDGDLPTAVTADGAADGEAFKSGHRDTAVIEAVFGELGVAGRSQGDNLGQVNVQLTASEVRSTPTRVIVAAWRRELPQIPGVDRVVISGRRGGPPGRDVDVRLERAPVEVLKAAAEELKVALTSVAGVSAIEDDLPYGKQELLFELTPRGSALGFTGQAVGTQVRNAFEGAVATRFARGDDEITVRVKREQEIAGIAALERMYLTTPAGDRVPLREVVRISERQNFSIVQRRDGVRTVAVTADLDTDVTTTEKVIAQLDAKVMPDLVAKYGIEYRYAGRDEERRESFADLNSGALLALALIYIILGWVFASYWKPIAVMMIIPFGFVGAVFGHYVMGYALTIISMIGLLGLSGILVNDSIVLVSRVKERLDAGETLASAATGAARDRFRAVLLTSLTTIGGLTPLMFETSLQAQFLIPLAVTLVFGLAGATVLVLMLVPALVGIGGDFADLARALKRLYWPDRAPAGHAEPAE